MWKSIEPFIHTVYNRRPGIPLLVILLICINTTFPARAADQSVISVLNPTGYAPAIERKPMAGRPASLDGKTIYLVDITFNNGDVFLKEMQKWFKANMPAVKTVYRAKKGAYFSDDPDLWNEIQSAGGLMIMAIGH